MLDWIGGSVAWYFLCETEIYAFLGLQDVVASLQDNPESIPSLSIIFVASRETGESDNFPRSHSSFANSTSNAFKLRDSRTEQSNGMMDVFEGE